MTKRLSANIFNIQSELDNKDLELLRNKSLITSLKAEISKMNSNFLSNWMY